MMTNKIGLKKFAAETDDALIGELIGILQIVETDMTLFFRKLANVTADNESPQDLFVLDQAYYKPEEITTGYKNRMNNWLHTYHKRLRQDNQPDEAWHIKMNSVNPSGRAAGTAAKTICRTPRKSPFCS